MVINYELKITNYDQKNNVILSETKNRFNCSRVINGMLHCIQHDREKI